MKYSYTEESNYEEIKKAGNPDQLEPIIIKHVDTSKPQQQQKSISRKRRKEEKKNISPLYICTMIKTKNNKLISHIAIDFPIDGKILLFTFLYHRIPFFVPIVPKGFSKFE